MTKTTTMFIHRRTSAVFMFCTVILFSNPGAVLKPSKAQRVSNSRCNVSGVYSGRNLSHTGHSIPIAYEFRTNNRVVGFGTGDPQPVTIGGYRNTCDSVIISAFYAPVKEYYILRGVFRNKGNTISGTFQNLTNKSDYGKFFISKEASDAKVSRENVVKTAALL